MFDTLTPYNEAARYIKDRIGGHDPRIGIILGSGLGALADSIEDPVEIPYSEIPHFPVSTAIGHKGQFVYGTLAGKKVLAMQGRFHYYEGWTMQQVTFPIRVMKLLGIEYLFLSNAAGGLNLTYKVGDIMVLRDHISMLPNPLIGNNLDEFGPRFPDMTRPYDSKLRQLAHDKAAELGFLLKDGVYIACTGPSYETPAEYKFFRRIGADAVGMSTVPEVAVARHCGIPCFAVSVITDLAHDDVPEDYVTDGEAIVKAADLAASKMTALFYKMIEAVI